MRTQVVVCDGCGKTKTIGNPGSDECVAACPSPKLGAGGSSMAWGPEDLCADCWPEFVGPRFRKWLVETLERADEKNREYLRGMLGPVLLSILERDGLSR